MKFLICDNFNQCIGSDNLRNRFKKYAGFPISKMRDLFVSHYYSSWSKEEKERAAKVMGHSIGCQTRLYDKFNKT